MNYSSNGIGVIGDAVIAIGLYIAFYYGLTGFACAWYYRRNLTSSTRNLWMQGILPVPGGLILFFLGGWSVWLDYDVATANDYTMWTVPWLHWQVGGAFVIAVVAALVGVACFLYCRYTGPGLLQEADPHQEHSDPRAGRVDLPPGPGTRGGVPGVGGTAYAGRVTALTTDALLDDLNPQQRAAVMHQGGPLLIVAGAGSGKTRVLTRRIAYLLAERDVSPGEILAITFTNKAAGEMAARAAALTGRGRAAMWVMTFHSACVRILRREAQRFGYPSSFSIYDQADSQRLMALVCRELDLDTKHHPPKAMLGPGLQAQERAHRPRDLRRPRATATGSKALAEAYARVPAQAGRGRGDGLRRPDHDHRLPAAGVPRGRAGLPAPVPARAGGRVPGHQPRPVHPGPGAGRPRRGGRHGDDAAEEPAAGRAVRGG